MFGSDLSKCIPTNLSGSFVKVAPFSADQAGQSSNQKAYQAQSSQTFPDGNVLPGTGNTVDLTDDDVPGLIDEWMSEVDPSSGLTTPGGVTDLSLFGVNPFFL